MTLPLAGRHIAVLMGGLSPERDISLITGKACAEALVRRGYRVSSIDVTPEIAAALGVGVFLRLRKPVLLKRGMSATLEELLMAAEYVMSEGNYQVAFCERGIRTFTDHTRNTLDLAAVAVAKKESHLPVIVDPSHSAGMRELIPYSMQALHERLH
mgnify:CR=1 FL=1